MLILKLKNNRGPLIKVIIIVVIARIMFYGAPLGGGVKLGRAPGQINSHHGLGLAPPVKKI